MKKVMDQATPGQNQKNVFKNLSPPADTMNIVEKCLYEHSDGLLIANSEGVGLWVNMTMEKITGLSQDCFLQKPISDLFKNNIFQYPSITERARNNQDKLIDIQIVKHTGSVTLVSATPVINKNRTDYIITTVRDYKNIYQLSPSYPPFDKKRVYGKRTNLPLLLQSLGIVYCSQIMREVIELAAHFAATDTTVLITGETGVGKELVAGLIHELSSRRTGPFLKINCSALPQELVESELFGYTQGAFTGARSTGKAGYFEEATGGTLLLDEVAEIPLGTQVKLLRVLQDQEITRLGSTRPVPVDVRILAATNSDLFSLINEKRFRSDLYYRLNVVSIEVPSLRSRPEDIFPLLSHYLSLYCQKYGIYREFTSKALQLLVNYSWPGNVRELANLVHRLVLISKQTEITSDLLQATWVRSKKYPRSNQASLDVPAGLLSSFENYGTLREFLERIEKQLIEEALQDSPSIRKAAQSLGLPHPTLIGKMKKHHLTRKYNT